MTDRNKNKASILHSIILKYVVKHGHAPALDVMTSKVGCNVDAVKSLLSELSAQHGLILKSNSYNIWAAHLFSLMPTPIRVESKSGSWWACCALGALGIGSALHEDINISTKSGAEQENLSIQIKNNNPSDQASVIHVPYPVSNWWKNSFCPCGEILFFASHEEVEPWCQRHGLSKGKILAISKGIEIANIWWPDSLEPTWRRKTPIEINAMFEKVGLHEDFWQVDSSYK